MLKNLCLALSGILLCASISAGIAAAENRQDNASASTSRQEKSAAELKRHYVVLKGGVFYPQGDVKEFSTGFNGEIAYGFKLHPNIAIEAGGGYLKSSLDKTGYTATGAFPIAHSYDVYTIPITVAVKGIFSPAKNLEIYGMLGAGAYYVSMEDTAYVKNTRFSLSDSTTVFGGFLGAGATYDITDKVFLGLEAKYHYTSECHFRDTDAKQGSRYTIAIDSRIEGLVSTLDLGFRF